MDKKVVQHVEEMDKKVVRHVEEMDKEAVVHVEEMDKEVVAHVAERDIKAVLHVEEMVIKKIVVIAVMDQEVKSVAVVTEVVESTGEFSMLLVVEMVIIMFVAGVEMLLFQVQHVILVGPMM